MRTLKMLFFVAPLVVALAVILGCSDDGTLEAVNINKSDTYADIAGLVYIRDHDHIPSIFEPAEDATVKLWKRSDAEMSKWLLYADDATVDEDGYFLYEDVKMTGDDSLCEEYDWFKVEISGVELEDTVFTRFAHREPRDGRVRVDVILYVHEQAETPPTIPPVDPFRLHGHFTYKDEGEFVWGEQISAEATCPAGQNSIYFNSCLDADWEIVDINDEELWGNVGPAYARYDFYEFLTEPPRSTFLGRGYYYWDADWPVWGMHGDCACHLPGFIWIDFIDITFPP
ncbi:MAG: hypothetical protein V3W11_04130 [bacterium]